MTHRIPSKGDQVLVRRPNYVRNGIVEAVMYDKSGFWLAADGAEPRVFVLAEELVAKIDTTLNQA